MSSGHDDFSGSDKEYRFTITEGLVTAYYEIEDGIEEQESIDSDDSFVIGDHQITLTKQTSDGTEITVFSDPDGDGHYVITSESGDDTGSSDDDGVDDVDDDSGDDDDDDDSEDDSDDDSDDDHGSGHEHKSFQFVITDGEVTAVYELDDGEWEQKSIDDDGSETYTVEGSEVVRTETKPFGVEITRYADADGDGIYLRVSEEWQISPDGNGVVPQLGETLRYSPTDDDDYIAVRGGEDCNGGLGADGFVVREAAHLRIEDFNSLEDDTLIFDTGLGLTSIDHLASFITEIHHDGQDFIVNFGVDVSITLVGVQPNEISWDDVSVLS